MGNVEHVKPPIRKTLLWWVSIVFLLIFLFVGIVYFIITAYSARLYYQETTQKLNAGIAKQIVKDVEPFTNGEVNEKALKELFHYVMVINPAIEVYLLDEKGTILTYFAPKSKVQLDSVPLKNIQQFIQSDGEQFIRGIDPRHPKKKKVFSAAPVKGEKGLKGYIYVILASEDFKSVTETLLGSYILKGGTIALGITLIIAVGLGLLLIWLITNYLRKILKTVNRFKEGDLEARVPVRSQDELGRLGRAFNEMADTIQGNIRKIEDMEQARKELIANVSHDLRTPLTTLQGYTETLSLKGSQLTPEKKEHYLQTILQNSEKLKKLVEELFELSKLESRQVRPNKEPFFINELAQDIVSKYQLKANEKGVQIKPVSANDLPPVYADVSMVDRVIQNLVDNSIKYTGKNDIVTIELSKFSNSIEVKISDTGPGISPEDQPYIFERYQQTRKGKNGEGGSGLGLAIVKNMLEIQGLEIHVKSKPDRGTSFFFHLPLYNQ